MLKNASSALYILNKWMDLKRTCTDKSLKMEKKMSDFGDLGLICKVTGGQRVLKHAFYSYILKELINYGQT